jgi:hypothetical protein
MTHTRINNGKLEFKVSSIAKEINAEMTSSLIKLDELIAKNSTDKAIDIVNSHINLCKSNLKKEWI